MKYTIEWLETKSPEWKVATLTNEGGMKFENVSINKTKKGTGEVFPNFDSLMTGSIVHGEYWETPDKSKKYLFPPKPQNASPRASGGFTGGNASKLMKEKQENIEASQDRKEHSIKESSSIRDSVQLALAEFNADSTVNLEERIGYWRKFLLDNWKLPF